MRWDPQPAGAGRVKAQISWRGTANHQNALKAPTVSTAPHQSHTEELTSPRTDRTVPVDLGRVSAA